MGSTILKISEDTNIDFKLIVDEMIISYDCRQEANEIISHTNEGDFFTKFKLLELYRHYIKKNNESFISYLDNLKVPLIKEKIMSEGGCYGATID